MKVGREAGRQGCVCGGVRKRHEDAMIPKGQTKKKRAHRARGGLRRQRKKKEEKLEKQDKQLKKPARSMWKMGRWLSVGTNKRKKKSARGAAPHNPLPQKAGGDP